MASSFPTIHTGAGRVASDPEPTTVDPPRSPDAMHDDEFDRRATTRSGHDASLRALQVVEYALSAPARAANERGDTG